MTASKYYKAFFQCTHCGTVHKVQKNVIEISDDIYGSLWCDKCKETTKQLYVGDKEDDFYELCDITLDNRYYEYYKTKQNN